MYIPSKLVVGSFEWTAVFVTLYTVPIDKIETQIQPIMKRLAYSVNLAEANLVPSTRTTH